MADCTSYRSASQDFGEKPSVASLRSRFWRLPHTCNRLLKADVRRNDVTEGLPNINLEEGV